MTDTLLGALTTALNGDGQANSVSLIAVGDTEAWKQAGGALPVCADIVFVAFDDLTRDYIDARGATLVVSPLVAPGFDCVDVAARLCNMSFRGSYRVLCGELPNPAIVRREIRSLCPELDFDIVGLGPSPGIRKI